MKTNVLVEESISFVQDQGEVRRRARWQAVDVVSREREGNADFVAFDELVVAVHVGVVWSSRGRVSELVHVVDFDAHFTVDVLDDAEGTVLDDILVLGFVVNVKKYGGGCLADVYYGVIKRDLIELRPLHTDARA